MPSKTLLSVDSRPRSTDQINSQMPQEKRPNLRTFGEQFSILEALWSCQFPVEQKLELSTLLMLTCADILQISEGSADLELA